MLFVASMQSFSQTTVYSNVLAETDTIEVASLGGADTMLLFRFQNTGAYSIQCLTLDTVETAAIGVYLKVSNEGGTFATLGDSLSFAADAWPDSQLFTGTSFPYSWGGIYIKKNGATAGDLKFFILQK